MTQQEFLQALAEKVQREKPEVKVLAGSRVRLGERELCPLEYTAGYEGWAIAARLLQIERSVAEEITIAADVAQPVTEALRRDLLKACGVA